jgi:hypothetical protein
MTMNYADLKPQLDPNFKGFTKAAFIDYCSTADGRVRVGGPTGKGRITAKRALALLGVR